MTSPNPELRAYRRGYAAGRRGAWPEHVPPQLPNEMIARLVTAMRKMRDKCDGFCATLMEDDPWQDELGPIIDECDAAMQDLSEWLLGGEYRQD